MVQVGEAGRVTFADIPDAGRWGHFALPFLGTRVRVGISRAQARKNARGIPTRPSELRAYHAQLGLVSVAQSIADKVDLFCQ
jgi:hypothetical protein